MVIFFCDTIAMARRIGCRNFKCNITRYIWSITIINRNQKALNI